MKQVVTAAQAKEIDQYSIEELGMPGIVLMERAALKFAGHVMERLEKEAFHGVILAVCGSGNNGGDGMAAARILSQAGYQCRVYFAGDLEKMTESVKIQWNLLKTLTVPILEEFAPEPGTIIIDALFGTGLSREVTGHYAKLIEEMNHFRCFSVDIPSGLNADTGVGTAVKAEFTVTFGPVKAGLLLGNGRQYAGEVFSEEIGFPDKAVNRVPSGHFLEISDIPKLLPQRREDSNKGDYGRVLVFAGAETMPGAAYYAAKAAYSTGAGLVEVITCRENIPVLAGLLPAAVYTPLEELFFQAETDGAWKADGESLEQKITAAASVVLGPGLGMSCRAHCITGSVLAICSQTGKPLVFDADGLNILAIHPEWMGMLARNVILTPHIKEMSRLCKRELLEIKSDMVAIAKEFSYHHQETVLVLKDSRSVITNGTEYFINMSGNSGMAVGGSGDVLSGILGGIMAQAAKAEDDGKIKNTVYLAALGTYLHGLAGDAAKKESNAYSMTADDILYGLKTVLK